MIGSQFLRTKSHSNIALMATGAVALAGVAIICAMPKTRKAFGRWINHVLANTKQHINKRSGNWERDLANAQKLKGPMAKRRNATKIDVQGVASPAWKDEWSSE